MTTASKIKLPAITGIGSLPHHNIDAALEYSFQHDIPYLPQIPIRNPWEFMIAQAIEGLPGIQVEKDGMAVLDFTVWAGRAKVFSEKLLRAFESSSHSDAFEAFEPSASSFSGWQPFLWDLAEKKSKLAKVQIAGPMTCNWVLKAKDKTNLNEHTELQSQITQLILARSLAMGRRLKAEGIKPILFIDEPALYAFRKNEPQHILGMQELKLMIQTLQKEEIIVGLHCCSNTAWDQVLNLGLDFLAADVELSLTNILNHTEAFAQFTNRGGKLVLGIIPTSNVTNYEEWNVEETVETVQRHFPSKDCLLTPACGLALKTPQEAQIILSKLQLAKKLLG